MASINFEWTLSGESVEAGALDKYIKAFIKNTEMDTASAVRYVGRELGMKIVDRTPVDTRRAVAGWSAAGDALNFDVPSSDESKSGDSRYRERLKGPHPMVEFINNVPYVIYLEYGWSKQAPLGMVRISVAELISSGMLPNILAKSYKTRWEDPDKRYDAQESILERGLSRVKMKAPSKRSVAAHLASEVRKRRSGHKTSAALTRMQKSLKKR